MANNDYINRVDYGDNTLIDLTNDTVTEDTLVEGYTAHTRSGATITGTLGNATTSTHGLMSASDKIKLDNITTQIPITYDSATRTLKFDIVGGSSLESQVNSLNTDSARLKKAIEAIKTLANHIAYTDTNGASYISLIDNALYPGLSSISAVLDLGNNIIRESDSLNDLKQYLTVTATYSNGTTAILNSADYTLSGTIALASNAYDISNQTITISYGSKTDTVNVNVYNDMTLDKVILPTGYTQVAMIYQNDNRNGCLDTNVNCRTPARVAYGCQVMSGINNGTNWHVLSTSFYFYPYFRQGNSGARNFQAAYKSNTATELNTTWEPDTNYKIDVTFPDITINGTTESITAGTSYNDLTLYAFARHTNSSIENYGKIRLYYLQMYNSNNELIHNFIPCTDSSDNVGLYDIINETFITNTDNPLLAGGAVV